MLLHSPVPPRPAPITTVLPSECDFPKGEEAANHGRDKTDTWRGREQWTEDRALLPPSVISPSPSTHYPHPRRVLQLFLSRTAQRGPPLSTGQLLRRLGLLLLLVLGFLAVWTVGVLERGILHTPLVIRGHTPTGHHFYLCHHDRWDYIMVVGELLLPSPVSLWPRVLCFQWSLVLTPRARLPPAGPIGKGMAWLLRWHWLCPSCFPTAELLLLCWGSFLCYTTRAVPSAFHEPRYMGIALHNELLLSAAFHTARLEWAHLPHPHPHPNTPSHLSQMRGPPPHPMAILTTLLCLSQVRKAPTVARSVPHRYSSCTLCLTQHTRRGSSVLPAFFPLTPQLSQQRACHVSMRTWPCGGGRIHPQAGPE